MSFQPAPAPRPACHCGPTQHCRVCCWCDAHAVDDAPQPTVLDAGNPYDLAERVGVLHLLATYLDQVADVIAAPDRDTMDEATAELVATAAKLLTTVDEVATPVRRFAGGALRDLVTVELRQLARAQR